MIKVIANGSTLVKGGALQAYLSFYHESLKDDINCISWYYIVSKQIYREINGTMRNKNIFIIEDSPAKNRLIRNKMLDIEKSIIPHVVFTFFGPAYVNFKAPHLCGVADPWVTHSSLLAFSLLPLLQRVIRTPLKILYKSYWFRKSNAWVVETDVARNGLIKRLRLPGEHIYVVPNNCSRKYLHEVKSHPPPEDNDKIKILCFTAYYRHKNLELIPYVAKELALLLPSLAFEFVLTLPEGKQEWRKILNNATLLGVEQHVKNIGPVSVADGPSLYRSCHILFLPSLLETFSANYPEAMASSRPIVTTNLDFAKNVCGDAALYFEPKNPFDAARTLSKLINNKNLWSKIVKTGHSVLSTLPTPNHKYLLYKDAILKLYDQTR